MVFTGENGQWDTVRGRLREAKELHSFIETRSQNSSAEADARPHEEGNKHWSAIRFGRQFAKRRGSRRGSIVTIAGMEGGSRRGSVTLEASSSRRGSITIASPRSSMRRSSSAKHTDEKRARHEKRSRWGSVTLQPSSSRRGSITTASPRSGMRRSSSANHSDAKRGVGHEKRKRLIMAPPGLSMEEDRKELDAPRWKQAWLRRKTYMEHRQGGFERTLSMPPSLESSEALAGLTSLYKFVKAKYPNVTAIPHNASSKAADSGRTRSAPVDELFSRTSSLQTPRSSQTPRHISDTPRGLLRRETSVASFQRTPSTPSHVPARSVPSSAAPTPTSTAPAGAAGADTLLGAALAQPQTSRPDAAWVDAARADRELVNTLAPLAGLQRAASERLIGVARSHSFCEPRGTAPVSLHDA
ncbi:hypothetical protein T484DRAFT_2022297, partial [Baffinella frigidus]